MPSEANMERAHKIYFRFRGAPDADDDSRYIHGTFNISKAYEDIATALDEAEQRGRDEAVDEACAGWCACCRHLYTPSEEKAHRKGRAEAFREMETFAMSHLGVPTKWDLLAKDNLIHEHYAKKCRERAEEAERDAGTD